MSDATLQVHVDSDWAGNFLGRKSTTGVTVKRGEHQLRHMSCLQTLVALPSGEAFEEHVQAWEFNHITKIG